MSLPELLSVKKTALGPETLSFSLVALSPKPLFCGQLGIASTTDRDGCCFTRCVAVG